MESKTSVNTSLKNLLSSLTDAIADGSTQSIQSLSEEFEGDSLRSHARRELASLQSQVDDKTERSFHALPVLGERFKASELRDVIGAVLTEHLEGREYMEEEVEELTEGIANALRDRVQDLRRDRYKYVVQVVLGEASGAGAKVGARCLWDSDADDYVSSVFSNETIFCMAVVFAVYYY